MVAAAKLTALCIITPVTEPTTQVQDTETQIPDTTYHPVMEGTLPKPFWV